MSSKPRTSEQLVCEALNNLRPPAGAFEMQKSVRNYLGPLYEEVEFEDGIIYAHQPKNEAVPLYFWARCISTALSKDIEDLSFASRGKVMEALAKGKTAWPVLVTNNIGPHLFNYCRIYKPIVQLVYWNKSKGRRYTYDFRNK